MNRLQKKCLIAAAGTHFLVIVVLLCSAFISSKPKADNSPVLDMIPAKAIDAAFTSGVRDATPPPPTPDLQPPQPPTPTPTVQPAPPKPDVKPPEPVKQPEAVKPPEPQPDERTGDEPTPKPVKKQHEIDVDLKKIKKTVPKVTDDSAAKAEAEAKRVAKEAQRLRDAQAKIISHALSNIKNKTSSSTTVDMPGTSTVAYANYATIVKTVYTRAWILPDSAASDDANVKVSVTIARDGHVIESHIIDPSGDTSVDRSVQHTLDRVTDIEAFPDGATDQQRTYIINFNLKAKRQMLG